MNIVTIDDDVTDIDTHSELDSLIARYAGIASGHSALHCDRAPHCINDTWKLEQKAIAGGFYDAATVLCDLCVNQLLPMSLESSQRGAVIATHEAGVTRNIGGDNRCQAALVPCHPLPSVRLGISGL
jgi:hypothetical protein